jgi:hypothetical protein
MSALASEPAREILNDGRRASLPSVRHVFEQGFHFGRRRPIVQRRHQLNRLGNAFKVSPELGFEVAVQHDGFPLTD